MKKLILAIILVSFLLGTSSVHAADQNEITIIESSKKIQRFEVGDSNQASGVWLAFRSLLEQGERSKASATQLCESKNPVAQFYGLFLLKQLSVPEYKNFLDKFSKDQTKVTYASGCAMQETSLAELTARVRAGQEVIAIKDPREYRMINQANEYLKSKGYKLPPDIKISMKSNMRQITLTYGGPPPAGVHGADYLVKVLINASSGQIESCLAGP